MELQEEIELIPLGVAQVEALREAMAGIQDASIGDLRDRSERAARDDATC